MSNIPRSEILIYKPELKKFIEILNFSNFPSATKIEETNYYYSYHKSGCADSNWDSDLFYIKENRAVKIGNISGLGCTSNSETGIFIYKISNNKKALIKKILRKPGYYPDKWDFIKKYWTKNYQSFQQQ